MEVVHQFVDLRKKMDHILDHWDRNQWIFLFGEGPDQATQRLRGGQGRGEGITHLKSISCDREVFNIIKDQMDTMIGEIVGHSMLGLVIQLNDSSFTDVIGEHGLLIGAH
jgi:predicted enzyme involved in methoxymalonyl-ACP biosynthesis